MLHGVRSRGEGRQEEGHRPRGVRALLRGAPEDVRELSQLLHGRTRQRRRLRQADALQGRQAAPHHKRLHDAGRRRRQRQRNRVREHLRPDFPGRVGGKQVPRQAPEGGHARHGQRGTRHQRIAVLRHAQTRRLARREARGVRTRGGGHGAHRMDRGERGQRRREPRDRGDRQGLRRGQVQVHLSDSRASEPGASRVGQLSTP
mmetsp:Transcript_12336/g.49503  ORF Transcript_12336/g.49503 Transcript_12336/m.49503 type:complete len:203 (-) Transcript_12336:1709-2317(-)